MPLSCHHKAMERLYTASASLSSPRPTHRLLSQGLKYLLENCSSFDTCVGEDNPFYQEFVLRLQNGISMDEDCLGLFECLAIFFRIRQIVDKGRALSDTEIQVLHYFETCGEWEPQDSTVVSHWYWWRIPSQFLH
ncbi:MAG: hypothetical protein PHI96_04350 [Desulfovibrio sp.]|nr:hypothetical protein [Desulfovibrio sp.]